MARLELDSVSRRFAGVEAVKNLTMSIAAGRVTGLIGPNGAGKTTVVNLITGLLKLSAGRIRLDEREIGELQPHEVAALGIARTFQNIRLLKEASVLDNIVVGFHLRDRSSFAAQALGLPSVRRTRAGLTEQARQLLREFGMVQYAQSLAGELDKFDNDSDPVLKQSVRVARAHHRPSPCTLNHFCPACHRSRPSRSQPRSMPGACRLTAA